MNADGSGQTNLTNHPAHDEMPAFSPDGRKLIYVSFREAQEPRIYTMNSDGTDVTYLAVGYDPAFSPDGAKVAFVRNQYDPLNADIYMMNVDGSGVARLTDHPGHDQKPDFSGDGTKMVFQSYRRLEDGRVAAEVFTMNSDGSDARQLTNRAQVSSCEPAQSECNYNPAFSPDGKKVAFESVRSAVFGLEPEIFTINADGSGEVNLTNNTSGTGLGVDADPAFSPDGRKISFASTRDSGDYEVYTANADGTNPARLTVWALHDTEPAWQPIPIPGASGPLPSLPPPAAESPSLPPTPPLPGGPAAGRCRNERRGTAASEVIGGTPAGDRLFGLGGNDRIDALEGEDCLDGGAGRDKLVGGRDSDRVLGGAGADRLRGGHGNDRLSGGDGDDRLSGGDGDDKLNPGQGENSVSAGSGEDRVSAVNGRRDKINCGSGRDTVRADRRDRLRGCERRRIAG